MKIQIGQIYMNQTQKYLRPCLRHYGDTFRTKISQVCSVAWGIGDMILVRNGVKYEQELFVVFDTIVANKFFVRFMDWIRTQEYYQDDYVFDDIISGRLHMLILKIPDKFQGAIEKFKLGEYSKMYDVADINFLFGELEDSKRVIIRDHNYRMKFVDNLNDLYDTVILPNEFQGELDFSPKDENEIFNYGE